MPEFKYFDPERFELEDGVHFSMVCLAETDLATRPVGTADLLVATSYTPEVAEEQYWRMHTVYKRLYPAQNLEDLVRRLHVTTVALLHPYYREESRDDFYASFFVSQKDRKGGLGVNLLNLEDKPTDKLAVIDHNLNLIPIGFGVVNGETRVVFDTPDIIFERDGTLAKESLPLEQTPEARILIIPGRPWSTGNLLEGADLTENISANPLRRYGFIELKGLQSVNVSDEEGIPTPHLVIARWGAYKGADSLVTYEAAKQLFSH